MNNRRSISVKGVTYARLASYALGRSISGLVEEWIDEALEADHKPVALARVELTFSELDSLLLLLLVLASDGDTMAKMLHDKIAGARCR